MSEKSKTVILKKSDIVETTVQSKIYMYKCPLCHRVITSYYLNKTLSSAKLHLERTHSMRVDIVE
jgi:hypothetical protein